MDDKADAKWTRLQEVFLESLPDAAPAECEPSAERIWAAARGLLTPAETGEVLDRVVANAACAKAWHLAKEITAFEQENATSVDARGPSRLWWAAAAIVALAGGFTWLTLRAPTLLIYRGEQGVIRSLIAEDVELARDGATLRWEGPSGAVKQYGVRILSKNLDILLVVEALKEPEFAIPPELLSRIDGDTFLWQVEAVLDDGTRFTSETFVGRLGRSKGRP